MSNEDSETQPQSFSEFYKKCPEPTELSLLYDRVEDLGALFAVASRKLHLAAFVIMSEFTLPKRGGIVLSLLKRINRKSYDSYWALMMRLFSECAIFVAVSLQEYVNKNSEAHSEDEFWRELATSVGVRYYTDLKLKKDEIEQFKRVMTRSLLDYEDSLPLDAEQRRQRVFDALGRRPTMMEGAKFIKTTIMHDPMWIAEPDKFASNYARLST